MGLKGVALIINFKMTNKKEIKMEFMLIL